VTVFVVAVPEGLPLAVTIALAFSVKKMMVRFDRSTVQTLLHLWDLFLSFYPRTLILLVTWCNMVVFVGIG
jgi:hypothetical protein